MTRQTIQYVPMTNGVALIYKDDNAKTSEVLGDIPKTNIAARLAACWNACRDMDNPAKDIADLRSELSHGLSRLSAKNDLLREDLSKSETCVEVLQDQLRVNKLAYDALRDLAIGKTPVCPDLCPKPESAQPEVNVQDGAYHPFLKSTIIGPGVETTSYVSTDQSLAEENRKLRNAGCNLAEAAIRVASEYDGVHRLMLAVAEWATAVANEGERDRRLTQGCQTK